MSAKLIATQVFGVTMGVIGTGLIVSTINKAASSPRRTYMYDKLERFTSLFEEPRSSIKFDEPKLITPTSTLEPVPYF
jgi:tRNA uridine 5-carbamoylmethylation protein Kti12